MEQIDKKVKIVFRAIIPHSEPDIDRFCNKIGSNFRIHQAREKLLQMPGSSDTDMKAFDYHLQLTGEFESLLKYLSACNFPLHHNTELSIRDNTIKAKIDRFRYDHYPVDWTIVVTVFLHRINY